MRRKCWYGLAPTLCLCLTSNTFALHPSRMYFTDTFKTEPTMLCLQLKLEDLYGATESGKEEDRVDAEGRKEEASLEEESTSRDSVKDDEEVDDEDQDDDEDPKPRSFGKVAMASPQGGNSGSSGNTSFPTAFASISLATQVWHCI